MYILEREGFVDGILTRQTIDKLHIWSDHKWSPVENSLRQTYILRCTWSDSDGPMTSYYVATWNRFKNYFDHQDSSAMFDLKTKTRSQPTKGRFVYARIEWQAIQH